MESVNITTLPESTRITVVAGLIHSVMEGRFPSIIKSTHMRTEMPDGVEKQSVIASIREHNEYGIEDLRKGISKYFDGDNELWFVVEKHDGGTTKVWIAS